MFGTVTTHGPVGPSATLRSELEIIPARPPRWAGILKRITDLVCALCLLVVTSPLVLTAALVIKLQDRGPVLFRQSRVGRNGELFVMYKLRTMVVGAESKLLEVQALNARSGPLFKAPDDPRVTPLGSFLRASCIDELPQLFNVLRGDMSMVGPRPALPDEVAAFGSRLLVRHVVRPGITGLWQVSGRDHADFSLYEQLDLQYVEDWSLKGDLKILVVTVGRVLQYTTNYLRAKR